MPFRHIHEPFGFVPKAPANVGTLSTHSFCEHHSDAFVRAIMYVSLEFPFPGRIFGHMSTLVRLHHNTGDKARIQAEWSPNACANRHNWAELSRKVPKLSQISPNMGYFRRYLPQIGCFRAKISDFSEEYTISVS